jgi:hypothetical protein
MTRETVLKNTMKAISGLPDNKISEVADFVAFLVQKEEEKILQKGIEKLSSESVALNFLQEEEDLYTLSDLKKKF